ncbi:acidic mammalian chitinase-like [Topomyia yanbarensis]|uniref:acidic mammalian chitinase-like n=1 Tax=Topomyia yanbarensis TaxID=2498891 RepID=UPI00273C801E|nr:acidic mammalian chitinase-like [Topomyia yanbarensis]
MKQFLLLGLLFCAISTLNAATDKVFCYFASSAATQQGSGKFEIEDISTNLCTHIVYRYVALDPNTYTVRHADSWSDINLQGFKRFVALKQTKSTLKLLLEVGSRSESSAPYSRMASSSVTRSAFIQSLVSMLKTYGFDGCDLDWEYPVLRGGNPEDRVNFIALLSDMKTRFNGEGLLLSIAVAPTKDFHRSSYNVPEINRYVDFVNLMTFNLHGYWDAQTGHNSPLYAATWETDSVTSLLNVDACVRGWIDNGLEARKLILSIPIHGRTFKLASTTATGVGMRTVGAGTEGPYSLEAGILSYQEVCELLKTGQYRKVWDNVQQVPYAFAGNQWISFDDVDSVALKATYARNKYLGGVSLWTIDSDDNRNVCGGGLYPIASTVNSVLFGSVGPITTPTTARTTTTTTTARTTTTTPRTTTTTPRITTTTARNSATTVSIGDIICPASGFVRDPTDCRAFYQCIPGMTLFLNWRKVCGAGLFFDETSNTCNYEYFVKC